MSPRFIARRAAGLGLSLVALTDHNSALNTPAFAAACAAENVAALFGVEVTTREEVHVLALFENPDQALELGRLLYKALPPVMNDPVRLGDQIYVNENDEILGEVDKYLVNAVDMDLDETAKRIFSLDGLFIPAHIDRPVFSLSSQLGFLPDMEYSALEITEWPSLINTSANPLVANSDAHYPDGIGCRTTSFDAAAPTFKAFREALARNRVILSFGGKPS
jgi:hypothetical protein